MESKEPGFGAARAETIRYHRDFYSAHELGQPGTWLAHPEPSVVRAIAAVRDDRPVVAYDLGAGVGRHTIPMLLMLPPKSTVVAVDLLPDALEDLRSNAPESSSRLVTVPADLVEFRFDVPADLVVAFSTIEHLPERAAIRALLGRIAAATTPGGIVQLGLVCDRYEIHSDGHRTPAFLETDLSAEQATAAVAAAFTAFDTIDQSERQTHVAESRDGDKYELASTLVSVTLRHQ